MDWEAGWIAHNLLELSAIAEDQEDNTANSINSRTVAGGAVRCGNFQVCLVHSYHQYSSRLIPGPSSTNHFLASESP